MNRKKMYPILNEFSGLINLSYLKVENEKKEMKKVWSSTICHKVEFFLLGNH